MTVLLYLCVLSRFVVFMYIKVLIPNFFVSLKFLVLKISEAGLTCYKGYIYCTCNAPAFVGWHCTRVVHMHLIYVEVRHIFSHFVRQKVKQSTKWINNEYYMCTRESCSLGFLLFYILFWFNNYCTTSQVYAWILPAQLITFSYSFFYYCPP